LYVCAATRAGDFQRNDDIYEELERQELNDAFDPDQRRPRSVEEMAAQSETLRALFK
jgi:hypothetical protein